MLAALRDKEEKAAVQVKRNSWLGRVVGAQGEEKTRAEFMELGRVGDMMPGRDKDCVYARARPTENAFDFIESKMGLELKSW